MLKYVSMKWVFIKNDKWSPGFTFQIQIYGMMLLITQDETHLGPLGYRNKSDLTIYQRGGRGVKPQIF